MLLALASVLLAVAGVLLAVAVGVVLLGLANGVVTLLIVPVVLVKFLNVLLVLTEVELAVLDDDVEDQVELRPSGQKVIVYEGLFVAEQV